MVDIPHEQGELVAAHARDDQVIAHIGSDSTGDLCEGGVACRVAVAIIDVLEVVQVEPDQRHRGALDLSSPQLGTEGADHGCSAGDQ